LIAGTSKERVKANVCSKKIETIWPCI